jgi:hypothetical protein
VLIGHLDEDTECLTPPIRPYNAMPLSRYQNMNRPLLDLEIGSSGGLTSQFPATAASKIKSSLGSSR